jgi:sigma-E factor negative regulatory protein RseA
VKQDEVESQLSAMFDGELPAAECELLSRRIDRDDNLRARWSRYALIGAAMRSEPVATARSGFAGRVSAALETASRPRRLRRGRSLILSSALAATLVAAVAGVGVTMLREAALNIDNAPLIGGTAPLAAVSTLTTTPTVSARAIEAGGGEAIGSEASFVGALKVSGHDSLSYVTPTGTAGAATVLRTQLADYIVAHSAYSTPLLRRNVLSQLVTNEDQFGIASSFAGAAGAARGTPAGGADATRSASDATR